VLHYIAIAALPPQVETGWRHELGHQHRKSFTKRDFISVISWSATVNASGVLRADVVGRPKRASLTYSFSWIFLYQTAVFLSLEDALALSIAILTDADFLARFWIVKNVVRNRYAVI
jgi:hypothetical protein